jgi:hypothetical protein
MNDEEARKAFLTVAEKLNSLFVKVETLQLILAERGVFTDEEFERVRSEVEQYYLAVAGKGLSDKLDALRRERIHQLLESHEGTKQ